VSHTPIAVAANDVKARFAMGTRGMAWGWSNGWSWSTQYNVAQSRDFTPIYDIKDLFL